MEKIIEIPEGYIARIEGNKVILEPKENEDERIRKNCIHFLELQKKHHASTIEIDECISWLEKQGSQNLANSAKTCKDEPKFKVGDWVVYNNDICEIVKREEGCNKLVTNFGIEKELVNERNLSTARLWTIQDAKDGDVLAASDGSIFLFKSVVDDACKHYIALTNDNVVKINEGLEHYWETSRAVHPAIKEQRDFLFQKMKEAGYEWDADKKELRKIEEKSDSFCREHCKGFQETGRCFVDGECKTKREVEQKPAWSEEDVATISRVISIVKWAAYSDHSHPILNDEGATELVERLKSLKERYTWKPSDEQMNALKNAAKHFGGYDPDDWDPTLESLYNDLKTLKG